MNSPRYFVRCHTRGGRCTCAFTVDSTERIRTLCRQWTQADPCEIGFYFATVRVGNTPNVALIYVGQKGFTEASLESFIIAGASKYTH
jgi:hypothetical protein